MMSAPLADRGPMLEAKAPAQVAARTSAGEAAGRVSRMPGMVGTRVTTTRREIVNRLSALAVRVMMGAEVVVFMILVRALLIRVKPSWLLTRFTRVPTPQIRIREGRETVLSTLPHFSAPSRMQTTATSRPAQPMSRPNTATTMTIAGMPSRVMSWPRLNLPVSSTTLVSSLPLPLWPPSRK